MSARSRSSQAHSDLMDLATALELSGDRQKAAHVLLYTPLPKSNDVYLYKRLAEIARRDGDEAAALDYYRRAAKVPEDDTSARFVKLEAEMAVLRLTGQLQPDAPPKLSGPGCVR